MFRMSVYAPVAERVKSAVGSGTKTAFKMQIDKDGRRYLKADGVIDTYQQIQSHKESCDIQYIMERFANGDATALSKVQGLYGDFTTVPTSLNELQNRVLDAERLFYQLPVETREKFEHNPSLFYSSIGSESFNEILGIDMAKENPVVNGSPDSITITPEVNNNVQKPE